MNRDVKYLLRNKHIFKKDERQKYDKMYYDEFISVLSSGTTIDKAETAAYTKVAKELNPKNRWYNPYLIKLLLYIVPLVWCIVFNCYAYLAPTGFLQYSAKIYTFLYFLVFLIVIQCLDHCKFTSDMFMAIFWLVLTFAVPVCWCFIEHLGRYTASMTKPDNFFIVKCFYTSPEKPDTKLIYIFDILTLVTLVFSPTIPLFIKENIRINKLRKAVKKAN